MMGRWQEVRRVFTPPPPWKNLKQGEASEDTLMKIIYGFTTIEYRDTRGRRAPTFTTLYGDQRVKS